jgi:hypothetical protein
MNKPREEIVSHGACCSQGNRAHTKLGTVTLALFCWGSAIWQRLVLLSRWWRVI